MNAPSFTLADQNNNRHSLTDYKGKWVVVYFYPKDDTLGCVKEACSFRDAIDVFHVRGVVVLGISKDTVDSHNKFADKYHLNFPLLSDPEHKIIDAFGAWGKKKFMGREFFGTLRNSYLIDPHGKIVKQYVNVNPLTHPVQILTDLESLL